ncbi:hypothetical protein A3H10_01315 [Candidatus Uhrbacteria bacterium RIFCSPLOWO2_12_FULL_46_10]|uniref:Uncharacterized protein n=1 Tax=Candidatus Uhrbacteria bacterium RIFCSPLOWO2_01_FULL_47_25 TaxID=1802402 RepID=A0A1F7UY95_9BACT|nr:MAG: hypothetical protein UX68_C0002G0013 [Parcubacteria group bacterium GW2011_GWA2_46_9]OGL60114.1 MAG: hypothetical protein A2752_03860 [Candidatus Uhrbacteria bacterium RIFCSPHIGHO2_01_FULL_46_23]OGL69039.1 MAG: hypothetical protein A3D60_04565 [Candidatus Uhrbacteria bacterium RIFCSPHIGHO2_02_FULL_47_29]OGL76581.1 MAG: hypothetical protein A3E96_04215 [Candidatus Uhrbacteria bacterium RIFCSPHIGHO2_12_FULL_46_13]OGL83206.1 MAG: hypothetical protein A2936_04700 [Candidatus Uhrbacteria bac
MANESGQNVDARLLGLGQDTTGGDENMRRRQLDGERQTMKRAVSLVTGGGITQTLAGQKKMSVDKLILLATGGTISLVTIFYMFVVIFTIFIATAVVVNIIYRFVTAVTNVVK